MPPFVRVRNAAALGEDPAAPQASLLTSLMPIGKLGIDLFSTWTGNKLAKEQNATQQQVLAAQLAAQRQQTEMSRQLAAAAGQQPPPSNLPMILGIAGGAVALLAVGYFLLKRK